MAQLSGFCPSTSNRCPEQTQIPDRGRGITQYAPRLLLLALMLLFTAWFSAYTIGLHNAHLTHTADLGQMDLAIWNTSRGRILQEIKDETISTRLTDHVEPIFLPVSLILWIWDDVRALLVFQAAALAAGAWPIYLLARRRLHAPGAPARPAEPEQAADKVPSLWAVSDTSEWAAVIFAAAYLLAPALQAAAVAEFHALSLAAALVAWSLWAIEDRRWGEFAISSFLLMSVQEGMALLAAALGLYAIARALLVRPGDARGDIGRSKGCGISRFVAGIAVTLVGLAWFYATLFVIIPRYASLAYGSAQTPYVARFGALGDSFGDVLKSFFTRPLVVWQIATEPLRLRYLIGLLWPTAFLALLGPEIVLPGLPLLLANLLSTFPFQYSGELHYSAPLVPFFVSAGAVGFERVMRCLRSLPARALATSGQRLLLGAIVLCALASQVAAGYLPFGREFWRRGPDAWPQVTAHHRLLDRFAAQIPKDAALSVSPDLYPHLSHRELIYQFPALGKAEWLLVDVSGITDRHPDEVRRMILKLLSQEWGVVDAADGYILLAKGKGTATIPDAFYDFGRPLAAQPQHRLDVTFGDRLRLLGYDVLDDVKWRRTSLRFYWQVIAPLPRNVAISVQVLTPDGAVADDTALRSMPALIWYPAERWQPGEIVATQTVPWYLPTAWAPVISVKADSAMWPARLAGHESLAGVQVSADGRVRLAAWGRRNGRLLPFAEPDHPQSSGARFTEKDWTVQLTGWAAPSAVAPGKSLPVMLRWQAAGPAAQNYTVFLHLRHTAGRTIVVGDGTPTWFLPLPPSGWPAGAYTTWDAHALAVPSDLPEGRYDLVAGWFERGTGERLRVIDDAGNVSGNEFVLGSVTVHHVAGPRPDLACLLAPESCASLE